MATNRDRATSIAWIFLTHQGLTERVIARMLGVSNGVVHGYVRRTRVAGWPGRCRKAWTTRAWSCCCSRRLQRRRKASDARHRIGLTVTRLLLWEEIVPPILTALAIPGFRRPSRPGSSVRARTCARPTSVGRRCSSISSVTPSTSSTPSPEVRLESVRRCDGGLERYLRSSLSIGFQVHAVPSK